MKGLWQEFRAFAVKGNAFDLAVAVVVGNAFTGVVNSLVGDIVTPLLGLLTGNIDFKNLKLQLHAATATSPALYLGYGSFFQAVFNFLVISLSIFFIFKGLTTMRKTIFKQGEKATPPEQKPAQERLLEEIRDLLKKKQGA